MPTGYPGAGVPARGTRPASTALPFPALAASETTGLMSSPSAVTVPARFGAPVRAVYGVNSLIQVGEVPFVKMPLTVKFTSSSLAQSVAAQAAPTSVGARQVAMTVCTPRAASEAGAG